MGKLAFVFSGQGDQYPGMGKKLADNYRAAAEVFELFDEMRPGTSAQCFYGTEYELKKTKNTQPCLFAMEMAAASVLNKKRIYPDAIAGFSLGEVAAATYSGLFDKKTGFHLVCKRGEYMQTAADDFDTSMAAVIRLTAEQVENICDKYEDVYPVNYNCPGQITVSGLSSQMALFIIDVKEMGGGAIPLKVKGAFHSPFMKEAATRFAKVLMGVPIKERKIKLYSNLTGKPYDTDVVELLSKQICNPVRWELLIRNMIEDGFDSFIEIGPGRTLTNMIKKIDKSVTVKSVTEVLSEVEEC